MSPLIPRRRRRRSRSGRLVLALCALVLVALLVGGLMRVTNQSGPYRSSMDHSLATSGSVLADASNASAVEVGHLLTTMQNDSRTVLQAGLDAAVVQTTQQADEAAQLAPSSSGLGGQFSAVFSDRARALRQIRTAIDGLIGMAPLPVAGAPGALGESTTASLSASSIPLLSATAVTDQIAAAGQLLIHSDQQYRQVRQALRRDGGRAMLAPSVWVTDPGQWQIGSVASQVDLVSSSSTLEPSHYLVLRSVRLVPGALPTPAGTPAGTSALPPTTSVQVIVVVTNLGSVNESHVAVLFTLALQAAGGRITTQSRSAPLSSGDSVTLDPVLFGVKPGSTYLLSVAITSPSGQASNLNQLLQIAPST
jgi:hypothetical protein